MSPATIETKRLILRKMTLDDCDFAAALWGDPEEGKYLVDPHYEDGDALRKVMAEMDQWEDEHYFIAQLKTSGKDIGTCVIGAEGPEGSWGFGYDVQKEFAGQGFATEMGEALIAFALSQGISDFSCTVAAENKASCRIMEKLGLQKSTESSFIKEGTGESLKSYIYTMHL